MDFKIRAELDTNIMPNITIEDAKVLTIIDGTYYAIGLPNHKNDMEVVYKDETGKEMTLTYPIKPETKAIHFEDMLDCKNNPIFVSLDRKNGKGGDIVDCYLDKYSRGIGDKPTRAKQLVKYYKAFSMGMRSYDLDAYGAVEIVGIKQ